MINIDPVDLDTQKYTDSIYEFSYQCKVCEQDDTQTSFSESDDYCDTCWNRKNATAFDKLEDCATCAVSDVKQQFAWMCQTFGQWDDLTSEQQSKRIDEFKEQFGSIWNDYWGDA